MTEYFLDFQLKISSGTLFFQHIIHGIEDILVGLIRIIT